MVDNFYCLSLSIIKQIKKKMSLDQLFKTMHSDFEDFTAESDKFISNKKQEKVKEVKDKVQKVKSRSKYIISGHTLKNMVEMGVRYGRMDERYGEEITDDILDRTIEKSIKISKWDYFKLLEE